MGSIGNKDNNITTIDYARELSLNRPWNSKKMELITVGDKQILTNYGASTYPKWNTRDGVRPTGYETSKSKSWKSLVSTSDIVNEFIEQGYDKIRVFNTATGLNNFTNILVVAGYRRK